MNQFKRIHLLTHAFNSRSYSSLHAAPIARNASCILIGNELLTGKIMDKNAYFLSKFCFNRGIDMKKIEIISDNEDEIGETIHRHREIVGSNGYVFTSGGIGPTHDDITYEAIAKCFGGGIEIHNETLEKMSKHFEKKNVEVNSARRRMAILPDSKILTNVLWTSDLWVPLAVLDNVYILPGVPHLFSQMVESNRDHFVGTSAMFRRMIYSNSTEGDFAHILSDLDKEFNDVSIGCYPNTSLEEPRKSKFRTRVSFEGRDEMQVIEASKKASGTISNIIENMDDITN